MTKLKELTVGTQVVEQRSNLVFLVAAQDHPGYKGTTLVSRDVIRCACFDAAEPCDKKQNYFEATGKYGRNDYELSNINAWLNSGEQFWYRPTHELDQPPRGGLLRYGEQPNADANGLLREIDPRFEAAILESDVPTLFRSRKEQGQVRNIKARVFLPSRTELGFGGESGIEDGFALPLFEGRAHLKAKPTEYQMSIFGRSWNPGWDFGKRGSAPLGAPQIFDPKYSWWYWTRTPHLAYAYLVRVMSANGAFSYALAHNDIVGVRPMMNVDGDYALGDGLELVQG